MGIQAAPPTFQAALLQLSVCMLLSPLAASAVAYMAPLLAERFGSRLRRRLLQEVLRKDQAFFDRSPKGDLVGRLTLDVATLQTTLADLLGQRGIRSLLEVLGPMIIIAVKHPLMAVITCAVTPLLSQAMRSVVVRSTELSYQRQAVASGALEFASNRLSHVQTVQVFGQQEREAASFRGLTAEGYRVAKQYAVYQGLVEGAGRLAVNVGTISLLGFGGLLVLQGKLTLGGLLSYTVFNLFISLGLSQLAASLGDLGKAIGALERISDLLTPHEHTGAEARVSVSTAATAGRRTADAAPSHADVTIHGQDRASGSSGMKGVGPHGSGTVAATGVCRAEQGSAVAGGVAAGVEAANGMHGVTAEGTGDDPSSTGPSASDAPQGRSNGSSSSSNNGSSPGAGYLQPSSSGGCELQLRDVWYRYEGRDDWALRGLSLTVPPGSTLALVGPSGGGKSTVASVLLGLYQPTLGEVVVGGEVMQEADNWKRVRGRIAAVMQQPMLMSGSVAQQIGYGRPEATQKEIETAARQANAHSFILDLPQGYDTPVGERGHSLSGGQKQRLAIARALLCQPQILVLDEVTSALDVESELAIDATLAQLEGCTKLVIAHRLSTVRSADCIAVVKDGQVVESGRHEELLGLRGGVYRRLVTAAEL